MSDQETANHPAVTALHAFFRDMEAWEAEMIRRHRATDWENTTTEAVQRGHDEGRQRLRAIFDRHLEKGAAGHRDEGMSWGLDHPNYGVDRETILSVTEHGDKVVIETQQTFGIHMYQKYEMVRVGEGWKVRDNRKSRIGSSDNRWSRSPY